MKRPELPMILALLVVCSAFTPAGAADLSGKDLFEHYCSYCHGSNDGPGTQQLRRTRGADKALLAQRHDLAADYIQYVVRHGLKSMPPFVPSDLPDAKLQMLTAYLTSTQAR